MNVDFSTLTPAQRYGLMTQTIIPRPLAWVLSDSGSGVLNLAPFSYFTAVCSAPPIVMISMGWKEPETEKDTRRNIRERSEFVIHIPGQDLLNLMNESARGLPHEESEVEALGLKTVPFEGFRLPRLVGCRVAMACRHYDTHLIGEKKQAMILGEILHLYVDDDCVQDREGRWKIDASAVNPVSRLGPGEYSSLGSIIELTLPKS